MENSLNFDDIWEGIENFEIQEKKPKKCRFALSFSEWAKDLLSGVSDPDHVEINQLKISLIMSFKVWELL